MFRDERRRFIWTFAAAGAGLVASACQKSADGDPTAPEEGSSSDDEAPDVTAAEDLMREHGVLRRILLVYQEFSVRLRSNRVAVPAGPIQTAANLFRKLGEDYHEKQLEEEYIFPAVRNAGGLAASYIDTLLAQHQRGREITDYILASTGGEKIISSAGPRLADVLQSYVRMYENHAAREDTVVFPAWMETLSDGQLDEMDDKFEDIEHHMFGENGFGDAVKQVADIETYLGLADLALFTAPAPPKLQ